MNFEPHGSSREARGLSREARGLSRDTKSTSREARGLSGGTHGTSREPQSLSHEPQSTSRGTRGSIREPQSTSREARRSSREPRGANKMHENDTNFLELTAEPLNVGAIARKIVPETCGATVTLDGYVRRFTKGRETLYLVYEAYEPMALKEMRRLVEQAREQFEIESIGIVHRLGRLEIGETSVVVAVAAPHRRAAFEACEWLIKELKRVVPIWKKEIYRGGGEKWIEGAQ